MSTTLLHGLSSTLASHLLLPEQLAAATHLPGGRVDPALSPDSLMTTTLTTITTSTLTPAPLPPGGGRPPPPDYLLHTQLVCDRVLLPLVVTFGLVGNVLSLAVLSRKEMASPTNCFLTSLAISDLSLLLLQLPMFFGLSAHVAASESFRLFVRYYTVIMYVMTNVFLTCTSWLTVAVTVERFLSLRFMMHPRVVCSIKRAKRAIVAIFFASFLFHFSKFFEYVPNTDLSSPRPLLPTELSKNKAYDTAMHIANITLAALLPIVALIIFNSFLVFFLATHRRRMLKHKAGNKPSSGNGGSSSSGGAGSNGSGGGGTTSVDMLHVSCVVVAVVLVFVACHSLGVFVALNIAVHGRHRVFSDHLFLAFKSVNGLLVMLNSSVNFLLYCSISRKFRKMFATVFCRRRLLFGYSCCPTHKASASSWSLPVPLSENSMATAVSIRAANGNGNGNGNGNANINGNGYSATAVSNSNGTKGYGTTPATTTASTQATGHKEASFFVRPSPPNSSTAAC